MPVLSKEFLDIQATIECRFTLKCVRDMIRTYSQLDAGSLNKALISSNYLIPRQEDIRAQLPGANFFSKIDFKSVFWQLELDTESHALTVFHVNNKLYRYTRLIIG